jgi:hypothetical protein
VHGIRSCNVGSTCLDMMGCLDRSMLICIVLRSQATFGRTRWRLAAHVQGRHKRTAHWRCSAAGQSPTWSTADAAAAPGATQAPGGAQLAAEVDGRSPGAPPNGSRGGGPDGNGSAGSVTTGNGSGDATEAAAQGVPRGAPAAPQPWAEASSPTDTVAEAGPRPGGAVAAVPPEAAAAPQQQAQLQQDRRPSDGKGSPAGSDDADGSSEGTVSND